MKKIIAILLVVFSASSLFAQQETSTLTKKEQREIEIEQQYELTKLMLENKQFVLEADFLQGRFGSRVFVNSTINFIAVDSTEATLQIGSNWRVGPNGVGGVTAQGRITKWELTENEKKNTFHIAMNVMTSIGIYDVRFLIGADGRTSARLTGLRPGQLTFDGDLVPLEESTVFEGQSI